MKSILSLSLVLLLTTSHAIAAPALVTKLFGLGLVMTTSLSGLPAMATTFQRELQPIESEMHAAFLQEEERMKSMSPRQLLVEAGFYSQAQRNDLARIALEKLLFKDFSVALSDENVLLEGTMNQIIEDDILVFIRAKMDLASIYRQRKMLSEAQRHAFDAYNLIEMMVGNFSTFGHNFILIKQYRPEVREFLFDLEESSNFSNQSSGL